MTKCPFCGQDWRIELETIPVHQSVRNPSQLCMASKHSSTYKPPEVEDRRDPGDRKEDYEDDGYEDER